MSIWIPGDKVELDDVWRLNLGKHLDAAGEGFVVYGGPYFYKPQGMCGVKLAQEIDLPCDIDLPIKDYSIPDPQQCKAALEKAINEIFAGKELYAGCFGGKGRTGIFLALLAKSFGHEKPIGYVREHYHPHAVETEEQFHFVCNFNVDELSKLVKDNFEKKSNSTAQPPAPKGLKK